MSSFIGEMQIKTTMRHTSLYPLEWLKLKTQNSAEQVMKGKLSYIANVNAKLNNHFGKLLGIF